MRCKCPQCGCILVVEADFDDMGFTLRQFTGGDAEDEEEEDDDLGD